QLGGSFGIAVLGTYLTRHTAFHRADLVANYYPSNPELIARTQALTAGMMAKGATAYEAKQQATALLDAQMMRQAVMLAYNDAWLLILLCFLAVVPAVFLLRKRRGPAVVVDAH